MSVRSAVSIVTLGVADLDRAQQFYESLGWEVLIQSQDGLRVFRTQGAWLALYPANLLAQDAGAKPWTGDGFRGLALALNLESPREVDDAVALAVKGGGTLMRAPEQKFWGGYSGYVADPDGHAWEIAYNPSWPIGADGRPSIG
jgi:uncharacterized protein